MSDYFDSGRRNGSPTLLLFYPLHRLLFTTFSLTAASTRRSQFIGSILLLNNVSLLFFFIYLCRRVTGEIRGIRFTVT